MWNPHRDVQLLDMNSGDIPSPVQDQLCTCKHCGGQMTYAAEHAGMASQCPHCQNEVVLGNALPTKPPSWIEVLKNQHPKLTRYGSTTFWVILVVVLFYFKFSLEQDKKQKEADHRVFDQASPEKKDLINLNREYAKIDASGDQIKKLVNELADAQDDEKISALINKMQIALTTRVLKMNQIFPDTRAVKSIHESHLENAKRGLAIFTKMNVAVRSGDEKEIERLNKELPDFFDDWLKNQREISGSLNELMRKNGLNP